MLEAIVAFFSIIIHLFFPPYQGDITPVTKEEVTSIHDIPTIQFNEVKINTPTTKEEVRSTQNISHEYKDIPTSKFNRVKINPPTVSKKEEINGPQFRLLKTNSTEYLNIQKISYPSLKALRYLSLLVKENGIEEDLRLYVEKRVQRPSKQLSQIFHEVDRLMQDK